MLTGILVVVLLILIVSYCWRIHRAYDFFVHLGIPGPPRLFFLGNLLDILKTKRPSLLIHQWTKKYGHIFGYFEGHTPVLVISDPNILQDVFIKSFFNFHSHRDFPLDEPHSKNVHLFDATGLRWKRQRYVINPTFSSTKLKQMAPLIHRCVDALMEKLSEQHEHGQPFDIYTFFKRFTMDTIWSCAFGLDTNMQNNPDDPYLIHSQRVFAEENYMRKLVVCFLCLPEFKWIWNKLHQYDNFVRYWLSQYVPVTRRFISDDPSDWIEKQAEQLINKRIELGYTSRMDLLQLMLESVSDKDFIEVRSSFTSNAGK